MKTPKLEPTPRRCDLTVREMVSIIGGLVGSLCENADANKVRDAIRWWAETDAAWLAFDAKISPAIQEAIQDRMSRGQQVKASDIASDLNAIIEDLVKKGRI